MILHLFGSSWCNGNCQPVYFVWCTAMPWVYLLPCFWSVLFCFPMKAVCWSSTSWQVVLVQFSNIAPISGQLRYQQCYACEKKWSRIQIKVYLVLLSQLELHALHAALKNKIFERWPVLYNEYLYNEYSVVQHACNI